MAPLFVFWKREVGYLYFLLLGRRTLEGAQPYGDPIRPECNIARLRFSLAGQREKLMRNTSRQLGGVLNCGRWP